jgi:hypothetical protein
MKKQILATSALLALAALVPAPSHAQQAVQANVPFPFGVGSKTMPAGDYTVQRVPMNDQALQLVERTDPSVSVFILTNSIDGAGKEAKPKLVFHCYADDCFLSEVWIRSTSGRLLLPSRREREVSRANAENLLAVVVVPLTAKP